MALNLRDTVICQQFNHFIITKFFPVLQNKKSLNLRIKGTLKYIQIKPLHPLSMRESEQLLWPLTLSVSFGFQFPPLLVFKTDWLDLRGLNPGKSDVKGSPVA